MEITTEYDKEFPLNTPHSTIAPGRVADFLYNSYCAINLPILDTSQERKKLFSYSNDLSNEGNFIILFSLI